MSASMLGPLLLAALSSVTVAPDGGDPTIAPLERPADAIAIYAELNQARSSDGVALLEVDQRLVTVARQHALDMVARNYFGHTAPDGISPSDRLRDAGIHYTCAGENLAIDVSPDAASAALLQSTPHRENILEPRYRRVGIAAVQSSDGEEVFVEDFSD